MNTANALYNFNGETLPVSVEPQPRRLIVHLLNGTSAQVYWYYDQVMYDERTRMFSYPGQPPQELSVTDPMLHEEVLARVRRDVKSIHRRRGSTLVKVLVLAAALIAAAYFLLVPWLAGKLAANVPVSYEKQLGDQLFASLKPTFRIDTQRTAQVNAFFRELRFASPYEIRITVVEGDVANAFALPGGHIVVYNKLLNGMNDYTELAALLAHEFTHVQGRHSLRNMFRSLSSQIVLSLLLGDFSVAGSILLRNADELKNLSYSRSLESEADAEGARLLAARGIDCRGFVQLFRLLKRESGAAEPNEWLSSHPNLDKRMEQIRKLDFCTQQPPEDSTLRHRFLQLKTY